MFNSSRAGRRGPGSHRRSVVGAAEITQLALDASAGSADGEAAAAVAAEGAGAGAGTGGNGSKGDGEGGERGSKGDGEGGEKGSKGEDVPEHLVFRRLYPSPAQSAPRPPPPRPTSPVLTGHAASLTPY
jgi:hypothetical protein